MDDNVKELADLIATRMYPYYSTIEILKANHPLEYSCIEDAAEAAIADGYSKPSKPSPSEFKMIGDEEKIIFWNKAEQFIQAYFLRQLGNSCAKVQEIMKKLLPLDAVGVVYEGYKKGLSDQRSADQQALQSYQSQELEQGIEKLLCDDCFNHNKNHECPNRTPENAHECFGYLSKQLLALFSSHAGKEAKKTAREIIKTLEQHFKDGNNLIHITFILEDWQSFKAKYQ